MSGLTNALDELNKFIKENPQAEEHQKKIEEILAKVPEKDRLDTIFIMLGGSLTELNKELNKLKPIIEKEVGI